MEERKQYVQFTEPDKAALKRLLGECKGPDRTMAQMGEDTGLSPSMLSRINNGNITKPLSEDTLQAIFDHKAEGCSVEMEDLYRANGMVTVEERNMRAHGLESRRLAEAAKELAQQTIINELFSRGYAVKADIPYSMVGRTSLMDARTDKERGDLTARYDLGIILPELHDLSEWMFLIYTGPMQTLSYAENRAPEINSRMTIRRMMQMRNEIFLIDAWQPERLEGMKYSWVFADPNLYDAFREYTKTARLNNAMSTILVDLNDRVILKEEWMNCPMKDDYVSLFRDEGDRRPGTDYYRRPMRRIGVPHQLRVEDEMDGEDDE